MHRKKKEEVHWTIKLFMLGPIECLISLKKIREHCLEKVPGRPYEVDRSVEQVLRKMFPKLIGDEIWQAMCERWSGPGRGTGAIDIGRASEEVLGKVREALGTGRS